MEAVRVVVRCRPFSKKEKDAGYSSVLTVDRSRKFIALLKADTTSDEKCFTFDNVFDESCSQVIQKYSVRSFPHHMEATNL